MSSALFIGLLEQGNTGDEILAILDTLTAPTVPNTVIQDYGTLEDIDFWYSRWYIGGENLITFVYHWVVTVVYTEGTQFPSPYTQFVVSSYGSLISA